MGFTQEWPGLRLVFRPVWERRAGAYAAVNPYPADVFARAGLFPPPQPSRDAGDRNHHAAIAITARSRS
jgi:hypothetical protein